MSEPSLLEILEKFLVRKIAQKFQIVGGSVLDLSPTFNVKIL